MKEFNKFEFPHDDRGDKNELEKPKNLSQELTLQYKEPLLSIEKNGESAEERGRKIELIKSDLDTISESHVDVKTNEAIGVSEVFIKPTVDNFINLTNKVETFFNNFERKNKPINITDKDFWTTLELQTEDISRTIHGQYPVVYFDRPITNSQGVVTYPKNITPFALSPVLGENPVFMEIMIRDVFNQLVQNKVIETGAFEDFRNALFIPITERKFTSEYIGKDKGEIIERQRKAWKEIMKKSSKDKILKVIRERKDILYAIYAFGTDKENLIANSILKTDPALISASVAYQTANEKQNNVWDHETPRVSLEPSLKYLKRFYLF